MGMGYAIGEFPWVEKDPVEERSEEHGVGKKSDF
jgi:hypothetical protein